MQRPAMTTHVSAIAPYDDYATHVSAMYLQRVASFREHGGIGYLCLARVENAFMMKSDRLVVCAAAAAAVA